MMGIAERAYEELVGRPSSKTMSIRYSGRFKDYNANVHYDAQKMVFSLAREWEHVSEEIVMGLLQTLILKTLPKGTRAGVPRRTLYMDLYNSYIKNLSAYAHPADDDVDAELLASFDRVNERMFGGMMDRPYLRWGGHTRSQLGHYTYATNTIVISQVLRDAGELLDFVMYHELLHKKHKFEHSGSRSYAHTAAFKRDEHKFSEKDMDKELQRYLRGTGSKAAPKRRRTLWEWFTR